MTLAKLVAHATNKGLFLSISDYIAFCSRYLEFTETGLQARIVSQNESHYHFFQYQQGRHLDWYRWCRRPGK